MNPATLKPAFLNLKPTTQSLKTQTLQPPNPKLHNPKPQIPNTQNSNYLNYIPRTYIPKACNPKPCIPKTTSQNSQQPTLRCSAPIPKPQTLNPKPPNTKP